MSNWRPRSEYAQTLSNEQLKQFYIDSDPRKKSLQSRAETASSKRVAPGKYSRPVVRGRGEYTTKPKTKAKASYRSVPNAPKGASFSSDYGSRIGSVLGEGLQSLANVFGFGEYNIQSNSLLTEKYIDTGTSPPRVKNSNKGEATVFSHREYLGELITGAGTPTAFKLQSYPINPGNSLLFPLTSGIARHFQEWEVRGMLVELKSESSNTATSLSLGSMFCAVDYNVLDTPPINKIALENLEYACSNKPTDSIIMPVECARSNTVMTHMYVIDDLDYQGGDKRFSDLGNLFIGSYGCPSANTPIAEIWVTYEIAFFKPHLPSNVIIPCPPCPPNPPNYGGLGGHIYGYYNESSSPFADNSAYGTHDSPGLFLSETSTINTLSFPYSPDTRFYNVTASWRTQATITLPVIPVVVSASSGVTIVLNTYSGIAGNNDQTYSSAVNSNSIVMQLTVEVGPNPVGGLTPECLNWSGGTVYVPSNFVYWDIVVAELPNMNTVV